MFLYLKLKNIIKKYMKTDRFKSICILCTKAQSYLNYICGRLIMNLLELYLFI